MSTSVSDTGTNFYYGLIVSDLNGKLSDITREISTGKVAAVYGDLGTKAGTSLSLHARYDMISSYSSAINNVKLKTDQMDQAMKGITTSLQAVLSDMNKISQGGTPDLTLVQTDAQNAITSVMNVLNTSVGGQFVFGGNQTDKPPIADTTAAGTNVTTIVSAYSSGTSAASIIASLDGMTDAQLGYDPGVAGAGNVKFRADDNMTLDYTVKADESQFKQAITGLSEIANLQYSPGNAASFWTLFNDAKARLTTANTTTTTREGQLGVVRNQMASLLTTQSDTQLAVQNNISNIEDADTAALSSTLQTLQTQVQATYSIISKNTKLSLVNYLG